MPVPTSPPVDFRIDPRIRQRRIEVLRSQGRRRLRVVAVAAGVISLGFAARGAAGSSLLDVDTIRIQGADRTGASAILDVAGITRGDAMVDLDEEDAARHIEGLVWVERAQVRRQWPATVVIRVEERHASAVTRTNSGSWAVLDVAGRVLTLAPERPEGLVELEGVLASAAEVRPGDRAAEVAGPLEVVRSLSPALAARTAAVVVVHGGEIALKLNPRGTVRFGSADQLAAKVKATETVLASVDPAQLAVLDVRLPSSPVLTRG